MSAAQQARVRQMVARCLELAAGHFGKRFAVPQISFDLHARAAGQLRYRANHYQLRFNPHLFNAAFTENLNTTVAHEVAHYVTHSEFGRVKPHGPEWRAVMRLFGVAADVTHKQNVEIPCLRSERRWTYQCACQQHQLTTRRHNKITSGQGSYSCRRCGELLQKSDESF